MSKLTDLIKVGKVLEDRIKFLEQNLAEAAYKVILVNVTSGERINLTAPKDLEFYSHMIADLLDDDKEELGDISRKLEAIEELLK